MITNSAKTINVFRLSVFFAGRDGSAEVHQKAMSNIDPNQEKIKSKLKSCCKHHNRQLARSAFSPSSLLTCSIPCWRLQARLISSTSLRAQNSCIVCALTRERCPRCCQLLAVPTRSCRKRCLLWPFSAASQSGKQTLPAFYVAI